MVKMTVLIGYYLRGWRGLAASMSGLLLPSAAITVLMTAGFTAISDLPAVKAILKGVLPAAVGLSLAMSLQMAQTLLARAWREGKPRFSLHIAILVGSALLLSLLNWSPLPVLALAGLVALVLHSLQPFQPASLTHRPPERK